MTALAFILVPRLAQQWMGEGPLGLRIHVAELPVAGDPYAEGLRHGLVTTLVIGLPGTLLLRVRPLDTFARTTTVNAARHHRPNPPKAEMTTTRLPRVLDHRIVTVTFLAVAWVQAFLY